MEALPEHHFIISRFLLDFLHLVRLHPNTLIWTLIWIRRSLVVLEPCLPVSSSGLLAPPPQVSQESLVNRMSPSSLAYVFGVNLVRPRHGSISLSALTPINVFTEVLIEHFSAIFGSAQPAT